LNLSQWSVYRVQSATIKKCRANSLKRFSCAFKWITNLRWARSWLCGRNRIAGCPAPVIPVHIYLGIHILWATCQQSNIFIALKRFANNFCFGSCWRNRKKGRLKGGEHVPPEITWPTFVEMIYNCRLFFWFKQQLPNWSRQMSHDI